MKKILTAILMIALVLCLAACGNKTPEPTTPPTTTPVETQPVETESPTTEPETEPPRFTGPFKPYTTDLVDGELYNAVLTNIEENNYSIELWQQMFYKYNEIMDLQIGDTIEIDGAIVEVTEVEQWPVDEEGTKFTVVINPNAENISMLMWYENNEFYRVDENGHPLVMKTKTLEGIIDESVVYIDSSKTNKDGSMVVETGKEFLAAVKKDATAFTMSNTRVSFDKEAVLMICKDN